MCRGGYLRCPKKTRVTQPLTHGQLYHQFKLTARHSGSRDKVLRSLVYGLAWTQSTFATRHHDIRGGATNVPASLSRATLGLLREAYEAIDPLATRGVSPYTIKSSSF